MSSNFAKYIKERAGKEIVEDSKGFATYFFQDDFVYIEDLYVIPEARKEGIASRYADEIANIAKSKGYSKMLGSVCPSASGATSSIQVLISYGFKVLKSTDNMIYFIKEI